MKYTDKAPYQAPRMGDLDLMLERALLVISISGTGDVSPLSAGGALDDASGNWVEDW